MREWKFTCRNFMFVRKILKEYDFTDDENIPSDVCVKLLGKLQHCVKTVARFFDDEHLYDNWIDNMQEEIEDIKDGFIKSGTDAVETVNYRLEEFYDFCDDLNIFLPV